MLIMNKILKLYEKDNVVVALQNIQKGEVIDGITILEDIGSGHKIALKDFSEGDHIIKYGNPIGHALCEIKNEPLKQSVGK